MISVPQYRFIRLIIGNEILDVDIFLFTDKTTVVVSMLYYKHEHIIMSSQTAPDRKTALKNAFHAFYETKFIYDQKHLSAIN
ncbi:hypothetical protein [Fictibacillus phosphorivorans]|uniref:hypothetical protein n=1 Tax=Fictibacillus phosphorivorans TaxID=1221500 RepID=UPI001293B313|nr:hypothetical protein [Fictibacillus phosphorivorans]MQR97245.1 hypothetical protein [Fictibacillus phosphorivorans]